ncbi:MAG: TolC family protein [Salinivirgaceae bacterium]|nr:TolC family protein [Salinivirgaceae bacterium]MDY0282282.1 TolC family protein [Salinivirgaceae bacterium]
MKRAKLLLSTVFLSVILLNTNTVYSQELLTLSDAINRGLESSFSIQIARKSTEIAHINNRLGNAGFSPRIDLNANQSNSLQNRHLEQSDNTEIDQSGYRTHSLTSGIALNWTLFDGFAMFVRADKLELFEEQSDLNLRMTIENAIADIIFTYFAISQHEKLLDWHLEQLTLSENRLSIAREKTKIGSGSDLQTMQAELDFRTDSTLMLSQRNLVFNLKSHLNRLLNRAPETAFSVEQNVEKPTERTFEQIYSKMAEQNASLLIARNQKQIRNKELEETKSQRYPTVYISGAYNFNQTGTPQGSTELSRILGPSVGIGASLTLFNGLNTSRKIKTAHIVAETQQLMLDELTTRLNHDAFTIVNELNQALEMVKVEEEYVNLAQRNVEIGMEKYGLGAISDLELREIQNKLSASRNRLITALTNAQAREIELLVLTGDFKKYLE